MEIAVNKDAATKSAIIHELHNLGCCHQCILRYLGITEPYIYRKDGAALKKLLQLDVNDGDEVSLNKSCSSSDAVNKNGQDLVEESDDQPSSKLMKKTPCTVCLGLLDEMHGTSEKVLDQVAQAVREADIQTQSYSVNLSLPISMQFRAYFVWFTLIHKFSSVYDNFQAMKPEGVSLKNAWKWICTGILKNKVDPESNWVAEADMTAVVHLKYEDDEKECAPLTRYFRGTKLNSLSRVGIDVLMKDMSIFEFRQKFGNTPPLASKHVYVDRITCSHVNLFLAGRYNKYSRRVSQTPWVVDGKKIHDGSVEEIIAEFALPLFQAESEKFSASGREDVDVRMLGRGRPFLVEVVNPKRTFFTQTDMSELRNKINKSTELIQVHDLQLVDRKSASQLKDGEENKTKDYCALCLLPGREVTPEIIDKLNSIPVPLVLQQKTPIRVMHRRSLITRERSVYSIKAVAGSKSKNLFKLHVQTQAGTYVKELVHGDLGRTKPSIAEILGCETDIVSLDVESIDFPWPPQIDD